MNELISTLTNYLTSIQNFIWGPPMIVLLLGLGLLLTVNLRLLQLRKLSLALRLACSPYDRDPEKQGDVTSYAALCTALAATVGTANIAG
jgi:AGCS family alanine or glycine:cation symporter